MGIQDCGQQHKSQRLRLYIGPEVFAFLLKPIDVQENQSEVIIGSIIALKFTKPQIMPTLIL